MPAKYRATCDPRPSRVIAPWRRRAGSAPGWYWASLVFTTRWKSPLSLRRRTSSSWSFGAILRSEEHTSELQSLAYLVCRLLLEKKKHCKAPRLYLSLRRTPALCQPRKHPLTPSIRRYNPRLIEDRFTAARGRPGGRQLRQCECP